MLVCGSRAQRQPLICRPRQQLTQAVPDSFGFKLLPGRAAMEKIGFERQFGSVAEHEVSRPRLWRDARR
jgi:hypothetical protein